MATPNTTLGASHLIFDGQYKQNFNEKYEIEFIKKKLLYLMM